MSRSGRFGRQPRSAPSLTNTLVAIAREFQQQRAENVMNAWQKGGMFEGKKATDELVMAFWRGRVSGVSKDDPLHDTYQNAVTQLDYNINESKATADYAQGKKTDAQMTAFYMGWSKKVPRNSEFYRVLMRDAGQYMRNAKAKSEADTRKAAEAKYQSEQNGTKKQMEAAGEYAIETLRRVAQSGNAGMGIGNIIAAPGSGSDLSEFDPSDPGVMMKLMTLITGQTLGGYNGRVGTGESNGLGTDSVLFHNDDGKAVTGKDIIAQFQKLDPNFKVGTPFNVDYVSALLERQRTGLQTRIDRATKTGHMQDATSLAKSKEYVSMLNRQVKAYPVQKAYNEARADYDSVTNDPTASPQALLNAWQKYSGELIGLSKDPGIEANDAMRSQLVAEAEAKPGTPTLNETFTGLAGADYAGRAEDIQTNATNIERVTQQVEAVKSTSMLPDGDPNKVSYTYGVMDNNGNFVPQAGGKVVGAATTDAIAGSGTNAQTMMVDDPRGGPPLAMRVTATPIYAVAKDPRTGEALDSTGSAPIGYAYDIPKGGQTVTTYGFQTKDGFIFSSNPPWDDGLQAKGVNKDGQKRLEVDFTPLIEKSPNMLGGKDPVTGAYLNPTGLDKANNTLGNGFAIVANGTKGDVKLVFDPATLAHGSDERDWTGAPDPQTDFHSLTLANLMRDSDGMSLLQNLDKNPAFKAQLDRDTAAYAGVQYDAKGQPINLGDPAVAARMQASGQQTTMATEAKSFMDFVEKASATWQRDSAGSAYVDTSKGGLSNPFAGGVDFAKLATDLVKGTPFESLGNAFKPTTNVIDKAKFGEKGDGVTAIKTQGTLKVPTFNVSTSSTQTGPVGPATTAYTPPPTQTGSTAPTGSGNGYGPQSRPS